MVADRRVTRSMAKKNAAAICFKFRQMATKSIIKKRLTNILDKNIMVVKADKAAKAAEAAEYPDNSYLATINKHERDQHIRFQEEGHIYYVKGAAGYTSVTTFVHNFSKPFDQDAVIAKILKKENKGQYEGMNAWDIKRMWRENGRSARVMGTAMHLAIETYFNHFMKDGREAVDASDYCIGGSMWDGLDAEAAQFKAFTEGHYNKITPYRLEWCIYDQELKITGSIDAVFKNENGGYDILDWKRSKEIKKSGFNFLQHPVLDAIPDSNFWLYSLQLNLYKFILEKNYGLRIDNLYLVAIHPEFKTFQKHKAPDLQNELIEVFKHEKMLN